MACIYQVRCGDGVLGGIEQCDPPAVGAGCAATCKLEPGFVCDAPPVVADPTQPARCHRTVCGDRNKEGTEACDDGDVVDGDGCSGTCSFEPDCSSGSCVSACGDAVKLAPEACDDGNSQDGDGCSRDCQLETGFSCTDAPLSPPEQLNLRVTYRDFISVPAGGSTRHPDFEIFGGHGGHALAGQADAGRGRQARRRRAMHAGRRHGGVSLRSAAVDARRISISGIATPPAPTSTFRGRWCSRGWPTGHTSTTPAAAASIRSTIRGGSPPRARPPRSPIRSSTTGAPHNFGFTTEIRYFFQYRGGESLIFSGDDDVWIFVNRRLALDLGGLHTRTERTLAVDQSAAALGLTVGALYEVVLFHAERHSTGSNFKLTLTGFSPTSSTCTSACGDGVLAATEECDDGNRVGGDGCSSDCRHEIIVDYPGDVHRQRAGR